MVIKNIVRLKNCMKTIAEDTLSLWRKEGYSLVKQNYAEFRSLVVQAQDFAERGQYNLASVYAEIAASYAQAKHCGLFRSPELDQVLLMIGSKTQSKSASSNQNSLPAGRIKNVLHVATDVTALGGNPRLIRRWIQQDQGRSHSLVLTRQTLYQVPAPIKDTVDQSQGKVYMLNETIGGIVAKAKQLRKYAASADIVLLHTWERDVIPTIAFADKEHLPPVVYVNHGDHCFWMGAAVSDIVANLRESGMHLSQARRGIEPERNMLLPTILEPIQRVVHQTEAKRQIGIPEDSILLLSVARALKYRTIDGVSFADAHVSLLTKYDQAILIVIGPGDGSEDWSAAIQQTQGRIRVYGQTEDTALFYQAADIYVDSFPFVSNTSLLEAGSYSVPLVSRHPYDSDACEILGADMPGLTGNLIRSRNLEEYTEILSRLIEDEEFRLMQGRAVREKIAETHWGINWQHALEKVYSCALTLPRLNVSSVYSATDATVSIDQISLDEPDVFLPLIYGWRNDFDFALVSQPYLGIMPLMQRLYFWNRLVKKHGLQNRITLLLPEWLYSRYWNLKSSLKNFLSRKSLD